MAEDDAVHGWTAIARDPEAILQGKACLCAPQPLLVAAIAFPDDDPLVRQVRAHAEAALAPPTFNHSMRVYYFAAAILEQQFPAEAAVLARATLAMAALLHDIGTTHDHLRATRLSFEFYGGVVALELVGRTLQPRAPAVQAEAVAEAIMRHQDLGTTGTITFLGQLLQLATIYDNMGGNPGLVHAATRADVNRAFPRLGWSRCFEATIREETALKPWAHTTALGEAFPEGVLNNTLMQEYEQE